MTHILYKSKDFLGTGMRLHNGAYHRIPRPDKTDDLALWPERSTRDCFAFACYASYLTSSEATR